MSPTKPAFRIDSEKILVWVDEYNERIELNVSPFENFHLYHIDTDGNEYHTWYLNPAEALHAFAAILAMYEKRRIR